MIDRARAENDVAARAARLAEGGFLTVASFKGDRSIEIRRSGEGFIVLQRGFDTAEHECAGKDLRKLLKKLFRREFPRSNRLRVSGG